MYCKKCEMLLDGKSTFCPNCGEPIGSNINAIDLYNQGYYYYAGINGYSQDFQKAFSLFSKAADMGNLDAINYVGFMYLNGKGVDINIPSAIQWFTHALSLNPNIGHPSYNLGRIYFTGNGVPVNYSLAYQYFVKAIKAENAKNETYYGYACLFAGHILMQQKKYKESVPLFFEAVNSNGRIAEAWNNLGVLKEKQIFDSKHSCWDYYKRAADLGCPEAMCSLGRFHQINYGVYSQRGSQFDKDKAYDCYYNAVKWYEQAIKHGYEPAKKWLKILKLSQSGSIFDLF